MANLNDLAEAFKAAARASQAKSDADKKSFEEILSKSIADAMSRINGGMVDSYELYPWVVSNVILLADLEGYELTETMAFLREILE